ncbi:MAG: DUF3592 domain-containing protein [Beijerinckiaceae bacterium]|nr:DUF3592 domain-containing protein [Brevundimonas sp.]MCZ8302119.1 DUF3592 domain-containing protein [Beijerinckiaceae bacterium]
MTADRPAILGRLRRLIAQHQSSIMGGVVLVVVLGLFEIGPMLGFRLDRLIARIPMPGIFDSEGARWVFVFFSFLFGVIALATVLMGVEEADMKTWQEADAEITRSEPGFRLITPAKGMPRNHRIADIGYRFTYPAADGRMKTSGGSRIRIDEIIPEEEVEALLARYPLGSRVRVYYDPRNPSRNVLERQPDAGRTIKGLFAIACVFAAIAMPVMWLATHGVTRLASLPISRWAGVALLCGAVSAGFLWGHLRQRRWLSSLTSWKKVPGVIVSSTVAPFDSGHRRRWNDGSVRAIVVSYMPVVEYRYDVDGVTHVSRNIQADMTIAGSEDFAEQYVERYRPGMRVEVSHDPADPRRSALEATKGFGLTFIIAGTAFALVAAAAAYKALR